MIISTKHEMYRLFHSGRFGNAGINFCTIEDAEKWNGEIVIRIKNKIGANTEYYIPSKEIRSRVALWEKRGFKFSDLQLSAQMPEHKVLLQAEVMRSVNYLEITYSIESKLPMKVALKSPNSASGLKAVAILKTYMLPSDYDDLMDLFTDFPDSVIELSSYKCYVGNCEKRNTIIWEVRNY